MQADCPATADNVIAASPVRPSPLYNKLGHPSIDICLKRCLAAWRAATLLQRHGWSALRLPQPKADSRQATQFPSLERIGWNIKAAGQLTPQFTTFPAVISFPETRHSIGQSIKTGNGQFADP
jgi:hypothetical protein